MHVQELEKKTYLPKFAELEPELEIESVLTEVFRADKVKKGGQKQAIDTVVSVYEKYVTVKTRFVLVVKLLR